MRLLRMSSGCRLSVKRPLELGARKAVDAELRMMMVTAAVLHALRLASSKGSSSSSSSTDGEVLPRVAAGGNSKRGVECWRFTYGRRRKDSVFKRRTPMKLEKRGEGIQAAWMVGRAGSHN